MDDLTMTRTEASCPVSGCPWKYELTTPRPVAEGARMRLRIPPPRGEHLRPAEIAAGRAAVRPMMAVPRSVRGMNEIIDLVMGAARAQDEGVVGAHLASHTEAELAAAFPGVLDDVLDRMERAGVHPRAA